MLRNSIIGAAGSSGLPSIDLSEFVYNPDKSSVYDNSGDGETEIPDLALNVKRGVSVKLDGTRVWLTNRNRREVYGITLGAAWDWSSSSITNQWFTPNFIETPPLWGDDGNICYFFSDFPKTAFRYTASTPYNINTLTYTGDFDFSSIRPYDDSAYEYVLKDGSRWGTIDGSRASFQVDMPIPYSFSGASVVSNTPVYLPFDEDPNVFNKINCGWFNRNGKLFVKGGLQGITSYKLGTAYDVSTAVETGFVNTENTFGQVYCVALNEDLDKMMTAQFGLGTGVRFCIYEK